MPVVHTVRPVETASPKESVDNAEVLEAIKSLRADMNDQVRDTRNQDGRGIRKGKRTTCGTGDQACRDGQSVGTSHRPGRVNREEVVRFGRERKTNQASRLTSPHAVAGYPPARAA